MNPFQSQMIAAQRRTQLESEARSHRLVRSARTAVTTEARPVTTRRTWRRVALTLHLAS